MGHEPKINLQKIASEFPEFQGVFGDIPIFDEEEGELIIENTTTEPEPNPSTEAKQTTIQTNEPTKGDAERKTERTSCAAPKQGEIPTLQPLRTLEVLYCGAIVEFPALVGTRNPRQLRHLRELAFEYTFFVGPQAKEGLGIVYVVTA